MKIALSIAFAAFLGTSGLKAQRMPEIVAVINSAIQSGQNFECDNRGWVTYKKVNYTGQDYQSLLFFEFDLSDVNLIYSHNQYVFLENHDKYWIYVSHFYTDKTVSSSKPRKKEPNLLTSAAITLDLKPGINPEGIMDALKLLKGE